MQLLNGLLLASSAAAFVAPAPAACSTAARAAPVSDLNGWVADPSAFCFGLPGTLAPVGDFDPLGLTEGRSLEAIKKFREAELQHGRVAMLASVGLLVTEEPIEFHPFFEAYNHDIGPAIRHLDEVRAIAPTFLEGLVFAFAFAELNRATIGWNAPAGKTDEAYTLRADYYPGDIGFDPLGLKPDTAEKFEKMHTKELQNGRLAMIGAAGMVAQELVNGKEIFVNLGVATNQFDPNTLPIIF
ncbi:fucoxanthin chlorophyll a/c protein, LI818 clade [Pelagophyceae sp. CCMP2097]|nr:fucoxanthin chlorophyll a/c protein, LI818 clade [Pelagophyceae sp. CCMP2097]